MLKRIAPLILVVCVALPAAEGGATCESGAGVVDEAHAISGAIHVRLISTYAGARVCDGTATPLTAVVRLLITDGATVLCDRSVEFPAFDPFGFGAVVENAPADACGANITWSGGIMPYLPAAEADPAVPSVFAGLRKRAPTHGPGTSPGSYWWTGGSGTVPSSAIAYIQRGVAASG